MPIHSPMPPDQQLSEVDELLRTMPPIASFASPNQEHYAWLGRASALVHRWDRIKATVQSGWYIGTNVSHAQIERIIEMACEVSRVRYGKDLIVNVAE